MSPLSVPRTLLRTLPALAAAALCAGPALGLAAGRTSLELINFGPGANARPFDLNDLGQVLGRDQSGSLPGLVIYGQGGYSSAVMPEGQGFLAFAISNTGLVVGDGGFSFEAATYGQGTWRLLGTLGGIVSFGRGVNDRGQVVGSSFTSGDASNHAFLYSDGVMSDLGAPAGGYSGANAINNLGQVVGYASTGGPQQAALFVGGGIQFVNPAGSIQSDATDINDQGVVVGSYYNASYTQRAFQYRDGVAQDLGTLGGWSAAARSVNASGQAVGWSTLSVDASVAHATLWSGGRVFDLNDFAPTGMTFKAAVSINRYGQITGTGTGSDGTTTSYLLTLQPEWVGGDGRWDDLDGHWSFSGLGAGTLAGLAVGLPHDVVIRPAGSATVWGSPSASVRSLTVGGASGQIVTFHLDGGSTSTSQGTLLQANAVLTGSGRLAGGLRTEVGSTVKVAAGQAMQLTGGDVRIGGRLQLLGSSTAAASLQATGPVQVAAGGRMAVQQAELDLAAGLRLAGQLLASHGNTTISGAVTVLSGGQLLLSGASSTTFYDTLEVANGGELRVSEGSSATFFGQVLQRSKAVFSGAGTKYFEGGLSIGDSPGLGLDAGDVHLGGGNVYLTEIGGTVPGSGHDQYTVLGHLTFGGTLQLVSWSGFTGQVGQQFDLFDWGSASGQFTTIDASGLLLATGATLDTSRLYTDGTVQILAAPVPEPGAWALMAAGLGLLGLLRMPVRRRRALASH